MTSAEAGGSGAKSGIEDEYRAICDWVTKHGYLNAPMSERCRQLLHRLQPQAVSQVASLLAAATTEIAEWRDLHREQRDEIKRVHALHQPIERPVDELNPARRERWCGECGQQWPCRTAEAM